MSRRKPNLNRDGGPNREVTRVTVGCTGRGTHKFKRLTAIHATTYRESPGAATNAAGQNHGQYLGDHDVTHTYRCKVCGRVVPQRWENTQLLVWTLARHGLKVFDISYASDMLDGNSS